MFLLCSPGGTDLLVAPFALIAAFYLFDISLSNTWFLVLNTAISIHIIIFSCVFNIWDSILLRIGSDRMYFALVWYAIIMYLIPLLYRYENLRVWYEYIVSFRSTNLINISCWFFVASGLVWVPLDWWSDDLGIWYLYALFVCHHSIGSICWRLWRWAFARYCNFLLEWCRSMFL